MVRKNLFLPAWALTFLFIAGAGIAQVSTVPPEESCKGLPSQAALQTALKAERAQANGGFNLDMWGTIVNRDGVVCAVAFTINDSADEAVTDVSTPTGSESAFMAVASADKSLLMLVIVVC